LQLTGIGRGLPDIKQFPVRARGTLPMRQAKEDAPASTRCAATPPEPHQSSALKSTVLEERQTLTGRRRARKGAKRQDRNSARISKTKTKATIKSADRTDLRNQLER
jgi:hypothetical protein